MLLSYDPNGGYGHRDHVKVHHVGKRAAERVLEATMPRDFVERVIRLIRTLRVPVRYDTDALHAVYSSGSTITHQVNVRRFARLKQAALAAHHSQVSGRGRLASVMRLLVRLSTPIFGLLLGREWFVEPARTPVTKPATSIFAHN